MRIKYYYRKGRLGFGQNRAYVTGKGADAIHALIRPRVVMDIADLRALQELGVTLQEVSEPQHGRP